MDTDNESPWFDSAAWGFDWITDVAMVPPGRSIFYHFYYAAPANDHHHTLRSIWQNTIDYDIAPVADPIPEQQVLQNVTRNHLLDLNDYTSDPESPDTLLSYNLASQSPANCWVSLDGSWVNVSPEIGWVGRCEVTYRVSDSLKTTTSSFVVQVQRITSQIFVPIIYK